MAWKRSGVRFPSAPPHRPPRPPAIVVPTTLCLFSGNFACPIARTPWAADSNHVDLLAVGSRTAPHRHLGGRAGDLVGGWRVPRVEPWRGGTTTPCTGLPTSEWAHKFRTRTRPSMAVRPEGFAARTRPGWTCSPEGTHPARRLAPVVLHRSGDELPTSSVPLVGVSAVGAGTIAVSDLRVGAGAAVEACEARLSRAGLALGRAHDGAWSWSAVTVSRCSRLGAGRCRCRTSRVDTAGTPTISRCRWGRGGDRPGTSRGSARRGAVGEVLPRRRSRSRHQRRVDSAVIGPVRRERAEGGVELRAQVGEALLDG
jgi:hypothetical protein